MLVKSAPVSVKAISEDDQTGTFEAVVSVFGNVDSYGDVVMPGAFAETIAEWKASGDPIPVLYSHNSYDPDYNIGQVTDIEETDEGLKVKGLLDVSSDTGKARQVHRLLKGRRVKQFSFAYDVLDAAYAERDGQRVYELRRLKLYEVGPCLIGANQETRLIGAKSDDDPVAAGTVHALSRITAELKAGRVLSAANESRIRTAVDELGTVLGSLDDGSKNDGSKATAGEPAADDAKSAPMHRSPVSLSELDALEIESELLSA